MDILCCNTDTGQHFKAVAKSPVLALAERAAGLSGDLLISGVEMGGGARGYDCRVENSKLSGS